MTDIWKLYTAQVILVTIVKMVNFSSLSRKDFQIKHMGHRIELGEIETAMDKLPEIRRSLCIYDQAKNKIVAFYEGDIDRKQLSRSLVKYVPNFMVPNVFVQVDAMPLTKNGKIDRKELTARYQEGR